MASRVASRLAGCGWMTPLRVPFSPSLALALLRQPLLPRRRRGSNGTKYVRRSGVISKRRAMQPCSSRHGDARGLEVSPSSLLQNELVQRQIGNRLAQPAVLEPKVLQALHLLGFQPAEILAPDNTSPHSRRSGGLRPLCSGPARAEHRPAATSRRSLQACIASLPLQSSLMSKTYLKSDHFNGGGSGLHRTIGRAGGRLSETRSPGRGHRQSDLARRKGA